MDDSSSTAVRKRGDGLRICRPEVAAVIVSNEKRRAPLAEAPPIFLVCFLGLRCGD
jgi:hypothetical protein